MSGKVFEISGKIFTDDQSHQQILHIFYEALKANGMHFSGTTKDITQEYIEKTK